MKNFKTDFAEWYIPWLWEQRPDYIKYTVDQLLKKFERKVWAEKWGVYVEFLDSVGIQAYVKPTPTKSWSVYVDNWGSHLFTEYQTEEDRATAQKEAFRIAKELYEQKK